MSKKATTNLLISGIYFSGSGAVKDLLKEYQHITVIPSEFDDFRRAGLVGDQISEALNAGYSCAIKRHTRNYANYLPYHCGIKRTLKRSFNQAITFMPWQLLAHKYHPKSYLLEKRIQALLTLKKKFSRVTTAQEKINVAQEWTQSLQEIYAPDKEYLLFDQPIFANLHKESWPQVFLPYKLIIVHRDPRDQIADLVKHNLLFNDIETPTRELLAQYGGSRAGAIAYEIEMIQSRRDHTFSLQKELGEGNVLILKFEDVINHYDETTAQIEGFLGLDPQDHTAKKSFLDPALSVKNIGIYKQFLHEDELPLFTDIVAEYYEK